MSIRVAGIPGSLREGSLNKGLLRAAVELAPAGMEIKTYTGLGDIPPYNEDVFAKGDPEPVAVMKAAISEADAILISTPEYNYGVPGVLKNAIDWASRAEPGEKPLQCFDGKVCGLLAASPGSLGGLRGLVAVRSILGNIRVLVIPDQIAVPAAHEAFDQTGALIDAKRAAAVEALGGKVAAMVTKLTA